MLGCNVAASIGEVLKVTATVEAGPAGGLVVINNSASLNNGDNVRVSGGHGRARLTLVDGTVVIELYDATDSSTSSTGVSGSAAATAYLSQGGLTASVNEGSTCTVNVPNGGTFYILGTEAFIIYNPETQFSTAGNFNGKVLYDSANVQGEPLPSGMMVDIGPGGMSPPPYSMPFGQEEFERIVSEVGSPLDTVNILRERYGLPFPERPAPPESQQLPLFSYDGDNILPGVASDWTVEGTIDSGREAWTFYLDSAWRLENGEPLTAPLVVKMIMEQASPTALKGVEIFPVDDYSLAIQFFQGADRSLLQEIPFILFNVSR
jgi:ABC-type transport system substrate-binding protein